MCEGCPESKGYDYPLAYSKSEGVELKVMIPCPKCDKRIQKTVLIHKGGEYWEPWIECTCGWGTIVRIGPVDIHGLR